MRALACALLAIGVSGCGGSGSQPASTPESPPNTGLPVARRAQDAVEQQNQRTAQLEQQTGSENPAAP